MIVNDQPVVRDGSRKIFCVHTLYNGANVLPFLASPGPTGLGDMPCGLNRNIYLSAAEKI